MLTETEQDDVAQLAKQAAVHTETFCDECEREEVDPLGIVHGVNTPANKGVNRITDEIMERENLDPICQTEVRDEVMEAFYSVFHEQVEDKRVDSHVECFYCYEKKDGSDHIPILVSDDPTGTMPVTRQNWR